MRHILFAFCTGTLFLNGAVTRAQDNTVRELRYSGVLSQPRIDGEGVVLRRFEVLLLDSSEGTFFSVLDDDRDGSPWPESFGQLGSSTQGGISNSPRTPRLVYKYEGSAYTIPLPPLRLALPDDVRVGSAWQANSWTFEIAEAAKDGNQSVWKIDAREQRGRRQALKIAADTGLLLTASQDVFMGQGEQFELLLEQVAAATVAESAQQHTQQLRAQLLALQTKLARRPDSQQVELSPRQIADTKLQMEALTALAKGTPLQETVLRISQDIARQGRRVDEAMKRQQELTDKASPDFALQLIPKGTLESSAFKGKTVVLHFWKYAEKPLSEPYGQVGYLEFLFNKRKQLSVEVVGVAVNPALQQPDEVRSAVRSTRKLMEFMNITYPIGYDDGSLLQAFGDPRDSGGDLPLWVVVSPAGKVVHYHAGFYEIDRVEGLKQLDEIILQQTKAAAE